MRKINETVNMGQKRRPLLTEALLKYKTIMTMQRYSVVKTSSHISKAEMTRWFGVRNQHLFFEINLHILFWAFREAGAVFIIYFLFQRGNFESKNCDLNNRPILF